MDEARVTFGSVQEVQREVGQTPKERLQWALDFTQRDLHKAGPQDRMQLQLEYLAFSDVVISPRMARAPWIRKLLAGQPWQSDWIRQGRVERRGRGRSPSYEGGLATIVKLGDPSPRRLPAHDELRSVQGEWKGIIAGILSDKRTVSVGPFTVTVQVIRGDRHSEATPIATRREEAARLALTNLLGAYAHLVGECREEGCRKWFVARRLRQVFCSRTCQNRATIRAYRRRQRKERPAQRTRRKAGTKPPRAKHL